MTYQQAALCEPFTIGLAGNPGAAMCALAMWCWCTAAAPSA